MVIFWTFLNFKYVRIIVFVTKIAVNIEQIIPIDKVTAKPLIGPDPNKYKLPAEIKVVKFDQDISWEKLPLTFTLLAAFHLNHFLGGNNDLTKAILHSEALNTLFQSNGHFFLVLRKCVYYIPT